MSCGPWEFEYPAAMYTKKKLKKLLVALNYTRQHRDYRSLIIYKWLYTSVLVITGWHVLLFSPDALELRVIGDWPV